MITQWKVSRHRFWSKQQAQKHEVLTKLFCACFCQCLDCFWGQAAKANDISSRFDQCVIFPKGASTTPKSTLRQIHAHGRQRFHRDKLPKFGVPGRPHRGQGTPGTLCTTFEAHVTPTPTSKRAPFPWHWPITKHYSALALTRRSVKRRCIKSPTKKDFSHRRGQHQKS